jgi:hypothetical protein
LCNHSEHEQHQFCHKEKGTTMENNIGAELLGDIWDNGRPNENFDAEFEEEDGLDRERDADGILDGGVAPTGDGGGAVKQRSAECDLVSLPPYLLDLVDLFMPEFD